jgi:chromosome segregation ATPase
MHVFLQNRTLIFSHSFTPSFSISLSSHPPQLFNVVVDTEETGKQLLQRGKLKRRYTIIPLNKIASRSISGEAVKRAQALVSNAINCIATPS